MKSKQYTYTTANGIYPGIAPPTKTNTALKKRLALKTSRRPSVSANTPHTAAPTRNPTCPPMGMPAICLTGIPYSFVTAGLAIEAHEMRSCVIRVGLVDWNSGTYRFDGEAKPVEEK